MMAKWAITGAIHGGKYLGTVEAATKEEAEALGWTLPTCGVSLCHQCSNECEDPEIVELIVDETD
jgi:hypothetical protein